MRRSSLAAVAVLLALSGQAAAQAPASRNYQTLEGNDWEIGSGGTLNVQQGGTFTSDNCLLPVDLRLNSATAQTVFLTVANRPLKVEALRARIATAAGTTLTGQVLKVPDATATGSAAAVQTGTFNLNSAGNTAQVGVPVTTAAATLATGDTLWWSMSSTIGSTVGVVTVCLGPQ